MLLNIIRHLRGYVDFEIKGKFPERFINLALNNGIGIFNVLPYEKGLRASVIVADYRYIRPIARRAGVKLKIIRKHGVPFKIYKHRNRQGLLIGAVLFVIIVMLMQNFVWDLEINGLKTLSSFDVKESLKNAGISEGAFKGSIDIHKAERQLQLEFDKIGWMSVNIIGTRAEIEIKEKDSVPKAEYTASYNNVKAERDGVIKSINVRRGTALVKPGSGVSKGQLLVVGTFENAFGEVHFIDADAEITAETYYRKVFALPKSMRTSVPLAFSQRYSLDVFSLSVPLTFAKAYGEHTLFCQNYRLKIGREFVPVELSREQIVIYNQTRREFSEKEAKEVLDTKLALYKLFCLGNAENINENVEFESSGKEYKLTARLTCLEEIGVKENLVVNSQ